MYSISNTATIFRVGGVSALFHEGCLVHHTSRSDANSSRSSSEGCSRQHFPGLVCCPPATLELHRCQVDKLLPERAMYRADSERLCLLQILETLRLLNAQATILLAPAVEGLLRNSDRTTGLVRHRSLRYQDLRFPELEMISSGVYLFLGI